jgi:hypothetical protein
MVGRGDHRCGACACAAEAGLAPVWAVAGAGRTRAPGPDRTWVFDAIGWYASIQGVRGNGFCRQVTQTWSWLPS